MEYKNEDLGVSFTLPDKLTVRKQMEYFSSAGLAHGKQLFERYWQGATAIIENWQCDVMKLDVNLDEATDPKVAQIIIWSGLRVREYIDSLNDLPKN